jgi:hypothetical protein
VLSYNAHPRGTNHSAHDCQACMKAKASGIMGWCGQQPANQPASPEAWQHAQGIQPWYSSRPAGGLLGVPAHRAAHKLVSCCTPMNARPELGTEYVIVAHTARLQHRAVVTKQYRPASPHRTCQQHVCMQSPSVRHCSKAAGHPGSRGTVSRVQTTTWPCTWRQVQGCAGHHRPWSAAQPGQLRLQQAGPHRPLSWQAWQPAAWRRWP